MTVIYGSSVADGTLTTAGACSATTGGTETSKNTTGASGAASTYIEVTALGGTAAAGSASLPAQSGNGWIYRPGSGSFAAGNWSAIINFAVPLGGFTAGSLVIRFSKLSGGSYTIIGTITIASPTVNTTKTQYSFAATSMPAVTMGASDGIYIDRFIQGGGSAWGGDTLTEYESNSGTAGVANDVQITTSTFTPITNNNMSSTDTLTITDTFSAIDNFNPIDTLSITDISGANILSGGFALFANGTGTASFDHFRVTQFPDPALSLAPVQPRAGSTLVAWNANTPTNTTLATAISLDGVNFTDVSSGNGGALPGIFVQPSPTIDSFDSNSSASYTNTFRTGGATATWTYDTANSRIVATGGTNGIYAYSAISHADIDMVADMDRSDAGGLIWDYVDQSDFYYLVVADASASIGTPNQLTLNKVSSNTLTQLATAAITFVRGTYHRIHVTMSKGVITVLFDGASAISYTDGSPLAAGLMGLYNNGGATGSRFYELWMTSQGDYVTGTPAGDIVTGNFVYTKQTLTSTDPTATPQVLDITDAVHGPNIGNGLLIPSSNYHYTFISNNMDDLARKSNYYWTIGPTGLLTFLGGATIPAPWILNSSDPLIWELTVEYSNDVYSNRQVLINVVDVTAFSNSFVGNGQARSFACGFLLQAQPTITLNNQPQTVGLKGTTGSQFYYAIGDANLQQDNSGTILQQTDLLVVSGLGTFTTDVTRDNLAGQVALAALDGTTGIVEAVTDVSQIGGMNIATANAYGDALNARYGVLGRTVKFTTPKTGLAVGQTLPAFIPQRSMTDVQLTIISIETTIRTIRQGAGAANRFVYLVEAGEVASTGSWQKTIAKVKV